MQVLIRLLTIFIIFSAAVAAANVASFPKPQIFRIASSFSQRDSFDVYFYQVPKSKGTIVYLYGGGCLFPGTDDMLELYGIGKKLIENGYSIYVPHYRQSLKWDTGQIPSHQVQSICEPATLNQLNDIKSSISFLSEKLNQKKIFIWGHSYGAFLVNVMAQQQKKIKAVKGYISSNGWWNVTEDFWGLWFLSPISMSPILQNPQNLSRILIVHTEDDERIPFSQIDYFKKWINQAKKKPDYQLVLFPTGGHSYFTKDEYPTDEFLKYFLHFLN